MLGFIDPKKNEEQLAYQISSLLVKEIEVVNFFSPLECRFLTNSELSTGNVGRPSSDNENFLRTFISF
jgi:hypothetical protein